MKLRTLVLFFVVALLSSAINAQQQQLPNIADSRVQIKLPNVKGDSLSLLSFKGKVIVLDFWASWCGPCKLANKDLVKLYSKYKSQGLEIFSVSLDESKKSWQKAVDKQKLTWIQVNDPGGWDAQTAARWNIFQLPTTYLINKKGDVVSIDLEGKELEESIKKLLAE
jgi:thiol-disulfide isomerase/thioredoxin